MLKFRRTTTRLTTWAAAAAAYAFVLQLFLAGAAPQLYASTADAPFTICHTDSVDGVGDPAHPALPAVHAHCVVCIALSALPSPLAAALLKAPGHWVLAQKAPSDRGPFVAAIETPRLSQGPPQTA